jgi:hypothetical protein
MFLEEMSQENREEVAVNREMEVVLLSRELVLIPLQGEWHLP